jgi:hypothetical protein
MARHRLAGARATTPVPLLGSEHTQISVGIYRMHPNGVFAEFNDPHAVVAVASNDFHRCGVSNGQQTRQERPMGAVMVRCPETGRDIPTGLVTDRKSFDATPVFFARVYCPICRTEHEWFAKEAWVCEAEPRRQRNALL